MAAACQTNSPHWQAAPLFVSLYGASRCAAPKELLANLPCAIQVMHGHFDYSESRTGVRSFFRRKFSRRENGHQFPSGSLGQAFQGGFRFLREPGSRGTAGEALQELLGLRRADLLQHFDRPNSLQALTGRYYPFQNLKETLQAPTH